MKTKKNLLFALSFCLPLLGNAQFTTTPPIYNNSAVGIKNSAPTNDLTIGTLNATGITTNTTKLLIQEDNPWIELKDASTYVMGPHGNNGAQVGLKLNIPSGSAEVSTSYSTLVGNITSLKTSTGMGVHIYGGNMWTGGFGAVTTGNWILGLNAGFKGSTSFDTDNNQFRKIQTGIGILSPATVSFTSAGAGTFVGNVGIGAGITTPGSNLHVHDANGPVFSLTATDVANPSTPFKTIYAISKTNGSNSLAATVGDAVIASSNAGNDLIIANNGGSGSTAGEIKFTTGPLTGGLEEIRMSISKEGKVVIGNPASFTQPVPFPTGYKLFVSEGILTEQLKVAVKTTSDWSDYVFGKNYKLRSLREVSSYIDENKHLPDVPSAEEVVNSGINVAQMDATLLRKIEELTLYVIQQQKEIDALKAQVEKK